MVLIDEAVSILNSGGVVGLPTETVYGLAARIDHPEGIQKIFSTKERPFFDPLIVHVSSIGQARECAQAWSDQAQALAEEFWPGPLTIVTQKNEQISDLITSGLPTVGLRCPRHPLALQLIQTCHCPLAAPSANKFGKTSPTTAQHVQQEFGGRVPVLDGGPCQVGIESTIVLIEKSELTLLRPGILSKEKIEAALSKRGLQFSWRESIEKKVAPGMLKHHYMPATPLALFETRLSEAKMKELIQNSLDQIPDEVEGVKLVRPKNVEKLEELVLSEDPAFAARELYSRLREIGSGENKVIVMYWPASKRAGDWIGIWDRLQKAASLHFS